MSPFTSSAFVDDSLPGEESRPSPDLELDPPDRLTALRELLTPLEWLRLAGAWHRLPSSPAPEPLPVLLLPGLGGSELSMRVLGAALRRRNHRTFDWNLGRNTGDVPELFPRVLERIGELVEHAGEPLVTVGWSLGGYLAREAAREHPEWIRKVITLGSPVIGGPAYTTAARWYRAQGRDVDRMRRRVAERYATPLTAPTVALYSKNDGVVAWRACIDEWSEDVRHIEVQATHLAMGTSPEVLRIVLDEVV